MGTTATDRPLQSDEQLVAAAKGGDRGAFGELLTRHLHPAWRIALVAAPEPAGAEGAVVAGFCDGILAAHRHPDPTFAVRERVVATTRRAAVATPMRTAAPAAGEPVVTAFRALPEAWRSAVWLSEVEGGSPEQVAKVLDLDRAGAAALVDRATAGLRDRLAADLAARAEELDSGEVRRALRRLVPPLPDHLAPAVAARFAELLQREHKAWMAPWTERAVGAAAAAVLAVGLAGAALLGGRDRGTDGPTNLAAPALDMSASSADGESAAALSPVLVPPAPRPWAPVAGYRGASAFGGSSGSTVGSRSTSAPVPRPAPAPQPTPATPATPSSPTAPAPAAPAPPPAPAPLPAPLPAPAGTQVGLGVPGVVEVGVGECTGVDLVGTVVGCDPQTGAPVEIQLPGLPPLP